MFEFRLVMPKGLLPDASLDFHILETKTLIGSEKKTDRVASPRKMFTYKSVQDERFMSFHTQNIYIV